MLRDVLPFLQVELGPLGIGDWFDSTLHRLSRSVFPSDNNIACLGSSVLDELTWNYMYSDMLLASLTEIARV